MAMSKRMWQREQERRRREREKKEKRKRICLLLLLLMLAVVAVILIARGCSNKNVSSESSENDSVVSVVPSQTDTPQTPEPTEMADESVNTSFYDNAVFLGNAVADGINMYGLLEGTDFYAGVTINLENAYTTSVKNTSVSVVDQLKSRKFGKVFLFFGEHELSWQDSQQFVELYKNLIADVKEYQPSANIYVFSVPPAAENICNDGSYGITVENIKAYNKALKKLAATEKIYYIDSFAALAQQKKYLADGVSSDGINLNKSSCIKLLNYAADNAYIPDKNSISDDDTDDESSDSVSANTESGTVKSTAAPSKTQSASKAAEAKSSEEPEPTVNVLKDSHKE